MQFEVRRFFYLLCLGFLLYSFGIYLSPVFKQEPVSPLAEEALNGRLVFQKYNCQSCHQLYGLGGYLGPDLTNVYGLRENAEAHIAAMIKNGSGAMPAYSISDQETGALIAFLKFANQSGKADPRGFTIHQNGTISRK